MPQYQLATDGDWYEQHYYPFIIQREFPSYETFWQKFIIPLTRRPADIHFKDDIELAQIGRTANDICISQLHYSVLRHLIRAYEIRDGEKIEVDHAVLGLSALCGAQDVAFELLERFRNPALYEPWADKRRGNLLSGREAQRAWKKADNYPLQNIRDYRNNLIHARMPPGIQKEGIIYLPKIGKEIKYFDWRNVTNLNLRNQLLLINDFSKPADILWTAWQDTVQYLESRWQLHLLPLLPHI
jgi:hypothetical protein